MRTVRNRLILARGVRTWAAATLGMALVLLTAGPARSTTFTSIYSFTGGSDGAFPQGRLVLSSSTGVLYGATYSGGTYGWGTVYQLTPGTGGVWTQKVLYNFTGGNDGANPPAGLVLGPNTVLYGTTYQGGSTGYGTVFQVAPIGGGVWKQTTLYTFKGGSDGANPQGSLTRSTSGVLYGTTYNGGTQGLGTVFSLTPGTGGAWTERVLHSFQGGTDGANPQATLALSSQAVLYGTTYAGGTAGWGTVFSLIPGAGGVWTEKILYSFTGQADGGGPAAGVTLAPTTGVLYGTTFWGGNVVSGCPLAGYINGCGVVYQVVPSAGGNWTQSVLYTFAGPPADGAHPYQNLTLTSAGKLWGTGFSGGSSLNICFTASYVGCGNAFLLAPPATQGGAWTYNKMHNFIGNDGGGPEGVILNSTGAAFGATYVGGLAGGYGAVYQIAP